MFDEHFHRGHYFPQVTVPRVTGAPLALTASTRVRRTSPTWSTTPATTAAPSATGACVQSATTVQEEWPASTQCRVTTARTRTKRDCHSARLVWKVGVCVWLLVSCHLASVGIFKALVSVSVRVSFTLPCNGCFFVLPLPHSLACLPPLFHLLSPSLLLIYPSPYIPVYSSLTFLPLIALLYCFLPSASTLPLPCPPSFHLPLHPPLSAPICPSQSLSSVLQSSNSLLCINILSQINLMDHLWSGACPLHG